MKPLIGFCTKERYVMKRQAIFMPSVRYISALTFLVVNENDHAKRGVRETKETVWNCCTTDPER